MYWILIEEQREVSFEEASRFAEENGLLFIEASAKTYCDLWFRILISNSRGENVEEGFLGSAKKIYQSVRDGK